MLKKRTVYIFILQIIITFGIMLIYPIDKASAIEDDRPMTPIFDGNDGTDQNLKLSGDCLGSDYSADEAGMPKEFKSKKWTEVDETWYGKGKGYLTIVRWYFQYPQDAVLYPEISVAKVLGGSSSIPFPGWLNEIGDRNFWVGNQSLVFVKNQTLVYIHLNSKVLGRNYIEKVARSILKKL